MSERFWFRPRSFGYGATPTTWEGWALTLGSAIVTISTVVTLVVSQARQWPDRRLIQAACLVVLLSTLIATIVVSRNKTDGDWRWRP
jgi:hypothetical protein